MDSSLYSLYFFPSGLSVAGARAEAKTMLKAGTHDSLIDALNHIAMREIGYTWTDAMSKLAQFYEPDTSASDSSLSQSHQQSDKANHDDLNSSNAPRLGISSSNQARADDSLSTSHTMQPDACPNRTDTDEEADKFVGFLAERYRYALNRGGFDPATTYHQKAKLDKQTSVDTTNRSSAPQEKPKPSGHLIDRHNADYHAKGHHNSQKQLSEKEKQPPSSSAPDQVRDRIQALYIGHEELSDWLNRQPNIGYDGVIPASTSPAHRKQMRDNLLVALSECNLAIGLLLEATPTTSVNFYLSDAMIAQKLTAAAHHYRSMHPRDRIGVGPVIVAARCLGFLSAQKKHHLFYNLSARDSIFQFI